MALYMQVLGAHMVGPDSPEVMQGIAIALKAGAKKAHFDSTVGIHPTAAEEWVSMRTRARRVQVHLYLSRSTLLGIAHFTSRSTCLEMCFA